MTGTQLLDHYGTQLEQLGWKPAPAFETRAWTRADTMGINMSIALSVQTLTQPANCSRVFMQNASWR